VARSYPISPASGKAVPAAGCDQRPYDLDHSEWPSALQKAIEGTQCAGAGEKQHEPMAAVFKSVKDKHEGDGQQSECREEVHVATQPI